MCMCRCTLTLLHAELDRWRTPQRGDGWTRTPQSMTSGWPPWKRWWSGWGLRWWPLPSGQQWWWTSHRLDSGRCNTNKEILTIPPNQWNTSPVSPHNQTRLFRVSSECRPTVINGTGNDRFITCWYLHYKSPWWEALVLECCSSTLFMDFAIMAVGVGGWGVGGGYQSTMATAYGHSMITQP